MRASESPATLKVVGSEAYACLCVLVRESARTGASACSMKVMLKAVRSEAYACVCVCVCVWHAYRQTDRPT